MKKYLISSKDEEHKIRARSMGEAIKQKNKLNKYYNWIIKEVKK